jgi:hypothetical protein
VQPDARIPADLASLHAARSAAVPGVSQFPLAAAVPAPCPAATPAGFSCAMRTRIAEVEDFLKTRPGMIGIVLRDRQSGAVWQNKYADSQIYMAPRRLGGSYSGHPPA